MSTDPHVPDESPEVVAPRDASDFVLQLDFVPTWARKPAENPYGSAGASPFREERPGRPDRGDRRDRRGGDRRGPGGPGTGGKPGAGRRPFVRGGQGRDRREPGERRAYAPAPRVVLPLDISFIPERQQLSAVVRQLHASQKAYPLAYLAGLFLARSEGHLVKVEVKPGRDGQPALKLHQCTQDGAVFLDAEALKAHAVQHHLADFFDEQEVEVEPPAGQFACVGRCRLSGELLGPPNYHGYQERLLDLHRRRFSHLGIDEYRNQVEMVRDPAVVEQWKEGCRRQKVYRPKGQADGEPLKRDEAVARFLREQCPGLSRVGSRFMIPAASVRTMEAGPLRAQLEEAWARENRFPLSLMLALRPAFKRMRLHLFKAGRGETFVTAIVPKPLDAAHAVDELRAMLLLIREHPGWNRAALVDHLQPGLAHDSEEAGRLLSPLRWLIEKGHVIEFFNGTLSAPAGVAGPVGRDTATPAEAEPAAVTEPPPAAPAAPEGQ